MAKTYDDFRAEDLRVSQNLLNYFRAVGQCNPSGQNSAEASCVVFRVRV